MMTSLKTLIYLFTTLGHTWKKSPDVMMDLSTAYRWLRILRLQIVTYLPAIRKTILQLAPETRCFDAKVEIALSDPVLFKRFVEMGEQLYQAAVRLTDAQIDFQADIFSFLNFFLARQTGHPLLIL
jgi:hypothetical protein